MPGRVRGEPFSTIRPICHRTLKLPSTPGLPSRDLSLSHSSHSVASSPPASSRGHSPFSPLNSPSPSPPPFTIPDFHRSLCRRRQPSFISLILCDFSLGEFSQKYPFHSLPDSPSLLSVRILPSLPNHPLRRRQRTTQSQRATSSLFRCQPRLPCHCMHATVAATEKSLKLSRSPPCLVAQSDVCSLLLYPFSVLISLRRIPNR